MVTIEALREAFEKIAATACGTRAGLIRVVAPTLNAPRTFVVALPAKDRMGVYCCLADRMNFVIPDGGDPLVLTALEAAAIVKLALELSDIGAAG
jgi:hypothetical protein